MSNAKLIVLFETRKGSSRRGYLCNADCDECCEKGGEFMLREKREICVEILKELLGAF